MEVRRVTPDAPAEDEPAPAARNAVILCGRVSAQAEERTLPSGDTITTTRVVVDREAVGTGRSGQARSMQRVDAIDCVARTARVRQTVRRWQPGDRVYLEGALRRRFYRGDHGLVSRVEVEVIRAKRVSGGRRAGAREPSTRAAP